MPRNSSGVYSLPQAAFIAGTTILSAAVNSDYSDIATALTESLATTGVSTMTGPVKAAAGSQVAPSYTFGTALGTGWYLSGANEITWVANGVVGGVFASSTAVTWAGTHTFPNAIITNTLQVTNVSASGALTGSTLNIQNLIIFSTASAYFSVKQVLVSVATPTSAPANTLQFYVQADAAANGQRPFGTDEHGKTFPFLGTFGNCRLTLSGGSLLLSPYQGNRLTIDGVPRIVPSAGITLAASNTAATFVYIYAYMNGSTMTLEMSTTGYDRDWETITLIR